MGNIPNMTNSSNEPTTGRPLTTSELALVIISIIISTSGLCGYVIYAYIIRKNPSVFSNPFYTFALSLAIPDCVVSSVMIMYAYPVNLLRYDPYPMWIGWLFGVMMNCTWFALISHVAVISTNRMLSVAFYAQINSIFTKKRVKLMLASCYTFACIMSLMEYICACGQYFTDDTWTLECDYTKATYSGHWPLSIDLYVSNGMVIYVLLCNIFLVVTARRATRRIFIEQHKKNAELKRQASIQSQKRASNERSMIIQCALVSLILASYQASFWLMRFLTRRDLLNEPDAAIIENLLAALNSAICPLIYFTCSSEVRRRIRPPRKSIIALKLLTVAKQTLHIAGAHNHVVHPFTMND